MRFVPTEADEIIEIIEADETTAAVVIIIEEHSRIILLQTPTDNLVPSIQTFQLESGQGAGCISDTAVLRTSVQNLQLALGRTSTLPNLQKIIEGPTSLAAQIVLLHLIPQFTTHCITTTSIQK